MQNLDAFKELLDSPKKVAITTHQKPDADALGSSLGLAAFLKKKGHKVSVISPTDYPAFLNWMKGHEEVIIYNQQNEAKSHKIIEEAEVVFCLDFSNLHRINELGEKVRHSRAVKVLIDHHLDPEDFADYTKWSTRAAATTELLYELIVEMGEQNHIDKDIAECLYAGIMTDTGSFRHPNTTKKVHLITADLINRGADVSRVSRLIYDTNSLEKLKFIGYALSEKLVVLKEFNTAYISINSEELSKFNSKTGDTEGLVNYALSIEGIVFAAIIIDRNDIIEMSFRSVGEFSVNEFAKNHFDGGGHKNAAGGKSTLSLDETLKMFEELLPRYKEKLNPLLKKPYTTNVEN